MNFFYKALILILILIIVGLLVNNTFGMRGINILIQVISAIFLVVLLEIIGYSIYDHEYLENLIKDKNTKRRTLIIDGIYDIDKDGETSFNTSNKYAEKYIELNPSINQSGGAEYSYNFWLYKNNLTDMISSEYIALFMRGSKQSIYYNKNYNGNCLISNNITDPYVLVKNPLVRLSRDGKKLIVEYNTITNPDVLNSDGTIDCLGINSNTNDDSMLGIYDFDDSFNDKFSMITIVLKETSSDADILNQNNTNCKLYLNGTLILDRNTKSPYSGNSLQSGSTVMKHNKGSFYVAPNGIIGKNNADIINNPKKNSGPVLQLSDLAYYNYALSQSEITNLFNKKYNKSHWEVSVTYSNNNDISNALSTDFVDPKPI